MNLEKELSPINTKAIPLRAKHVLLRNTNLVSNITAINSTVYRLKKRKAILSEAYSVTKFRKVLLSSSTTNLSTFRQLIRYEQ